MVCCAPSLRFPGGRHGDAEGLSHGGMGGPRRGPDRAGRRPVRRWTHRPMKRLARAGSFTSIPPSCSMSWRRWPRHPSASVSRARRGQETTPSSRASSRMEAMSADSTASGPLGSPNERPFAEPEGEGCLDVASAA
ncbi:hypothetical protein CgunFtcFv8_007994 [Champsocephalus gunnari]|uniref:Uncharacterized protein n=1 Tax=Champsocephalus gunnari TaxID=52237 RepID=A0AAN8HIF9_CHAGU|nr:hypothetical protein CgunFtcFv8_007994 [Champsocephalus gunnari]